MLGHARPGHVGLPAKPAIQPRPSLIRQVSQIGQEGNKPIKDSWPTEPTAPAGTHTHTGHPARATSQEGQLARNVRPPNKANKPRRPTSSNAKLQRQVLAPIFGMLFLHAHEADPGRFSRTPNYIIEACSVDMFVYQNQIFSTCFYAQISKTVNVHDSLRIDKSVKV